MPAMNQINAGFMTEKDYVTGEQSSISGLEIFLAELGHLKRIVAGFGLNMHDSEDVLQDVSIQAIKCSEMHRNEMQCIHWLTKVTVNRCLTEHRRKRSFYKHAGEILKHRMQIKSESRKTDEKAIVAEELEIVRKNLKELDDSLLGPLVLRYFCNFNSRQVGKILDLKPSTVRSRLREARMILARRLSKRGIRR